MLNAVWRRVGLLALWGVLAVMGGQPVAADSPHDGLFSFMVAADMRMYTGPGAYDACGYFRGAAEAMADVGPGAFIITPGDFDPIADFRWTLDQVLGADYPWYPVVGNHELPGYGREGYLGENMALLRTYNYGGPATITRWGPAGCPETTYSFDYGNAHFVALNVYCDVHGDTVRLSGDVPDHLYDWLAQDLAETDQPFIFVIGHEPAFPQPDVDSGRARYIGEGLSSHPAHRDRFWNLLREQGVTAYVCGHTHNYSAVEIEGVWQVDVGHARGSGDLGARSTFARIAVEHKGTRFQVYRAEPTDLCTYSLAYHWFSDAPAVREEAGRSLPLRGPATSRKRWLKVFKGRD